MKNATAAAVAAASLWLVCIGHFVTPRPAWAATAAIDVATTHQVIRGFGGATVFQPPNLPASLTTAELDILFGDGPDQLGFTILRIRVAADEAWRAIELAHAQGAKARGAIVIATPWSPPAAMKSNSSLIGGILNPSSYADYAKYLNDFARTMATNGAALYAISVQNEPDIEVTYESCDWNPAQMLDFCRNHAGAITVTRLIAPESFQFRRNISDPLLSDDVAAANVDIIGGHIYGGGLFDYPLARSKGKEVWMTEHLDTVTDYPAVLATAKEIHDCLAVANFNAYIWWYLRRFYGPLGEDGVITKRGHMMAQFAKFIRPGFVRVSATTNPATGVHVSAYKRDKLVIVAVNQSASAALQVFTVQNGTVSSVAPWVTSSTLNLALQSAVAVTGGTFSATLPAQSVTTFVGDLIFPAPTIVTPPRSLTIAAGSTFTLDVTTSGEFPTYQWNRNGTPINGATSRLLTISNAQPSDAAGYSVTVANSGGSVTNASAAVTVVATADPGRLINLSTRSPVGAADIAQIGGFVVAGSTAKQVLVRAAGPELAASFNLAGALADPIVELYDQDTGAIVASNDNWNASLASTFSAANAFPWTNGSKDAALLATLDPGAYTAVVKGVGETTGLALVEVYEVGGNAGPPRLINISTRSPVGINDHVQIGGFVIGGATARTVVIRAAGPSLDELFGVPGILADPEIELRDQVTGALLATQDDWDAALASHFSAVGAFPWTPESKDAALVTTLDPGQYTVIVRGKNGGTGIALVEIYERP